MKILAIETSCDETAVAIIDIRENKTKTNVSVLGNTLVSQAKIHEKYGGVFPMMAKREHAKNLTPILGQVLREAKLYKPSSNLIDCKLQTKNLGKLLSREPELLTDLLKLLPKVKRPKIVAITVTCGPGLEPALWVGINFGKALSLIWDIPLIPVNHMEGHLLVALLQAADKRGLNADRRRKNSLQPTHYNLQPVNFPMLALLISGGHTELVLAKKWTEYRVLGATRDDAAGEAFDKVARMLSLPYPGGPQISALAEIARTNADLTPTNAEKIQRISASIPHLSALRLPRPMINSGNFDFSFAGLKTAVLYTLKKIPKVTEEIKRAIACEFEDAVTEVLLAKSARAIEKFGARTFALGGGVSANKRIRASFERALKKDFPKTKLFIPTQPLTTDNAIMIGLAGYFKIKTKKARIPLSRIRAQGNLKIG